MGENDREHVLTPAPTASRLAGSPGAAIGDFWSRSEAARLAAIVESSDDAIISKTLDGIITTWNNGAQRIFGYTADEMVGCSIVQLIPPDRQGEEPVILEQLRRGERIEHYETVRLTKDGRLINVSVTISPLRDSSGTIIGASKIARDITQQKQIESELRIAKETAESASRAKDHFLSVLSHELRTPLTPVLAAVSYMETLPNLPPDAWAQLGMIRRNVETEARLVDDLLDLTRIVRGKISLAYEVVDAHVAIRNALGMVQSAADRKGLVVSTALSAGLHHLWADAGRIQQVFLNILSNAVKFTPAQGTVSLRSENTAEGQLRIQVSDTGVGIPAQDIPRLFSAFEQAEGSQRFGGLGLGLSIARSLVETHGGTLNVVSPGRDQGSTFTLLLNVMPPTASAVDGPVMPMPTPDLRAFRILLVEDHEDTRKVMEQLLTRFGYAVISAASVSEAVATADRETFDLLISDLGLPDGSGHNVMEYVRKQFQMKGIALSGYGQEEDLRRSSEAGFETHLIKPVNFQVLRQTIQRLMPVKGG